MPYESKPDMQTWKTKITRELEALDGRVMLVGHSMVVPRLKYLSEENVAKPIAGLFLLAVPSWDEENWNFDNLKYRAIWERGYCPYPKSFSITTATTRLYRSDISRYMLPDYLAP